MLSRFMKIILKIISKIVAGYFISPYLWCKQKGKNNMKTYKVSEKTSSLTVMVSATSEQGAIDIAKMGYNLPLFGFYTVVEL